MYVLGISFGIRPLVNSEPNVPEVESQSLGFGVVDLKEIVGCVVGFFNEKHQGTVASRRRGRLWRHGTIDPEGLMRSDDA